MTQVMELAKWGLGIGMQVVRETTGESFHRQC